MDEKENVYRCNSCYQDRPQFSYSCPCSLCSLYYKDKDGSRTNSPNAQITQLSIGVRPYLHVACGNIYISTWKYTHKYEHNHVFKYLIFDWLAHSIKLDGV